MNYSQKQVSNDVGSGSTTQTEDQLWQAGLDLQDDIAKHRGSGPAVRAGPERLGVDHKTVGSDVGSDTTPHEDQLWLTDLTAQRNKEIERQREVRKLQALLLKEAGWSNRKVAERLNVGETQVRRDVESDTMAHSEDQLWQAGLDLE